MRSPGFTPAACSALASLRARRKTSAHVVRCRGLSNVTDTISRSPKLRSANRMISVISSGPSIISPCMPSAPLRVRSEDGEAAAVRTLQFDATVLTPPLVALEQADRDQPDPHDHRGAAADDTVVIGVYVTLFVEPAS